MKQSKILRKLLTASDRSFLIIDRSLKITDTSHGAERFAENPSESLISQDIRHAFPETVGLEDVFENIWLNQTNNFEIKGIYRSIDSQAALYFDFYIIGANDIEESDKSIIICIENTTEIMVMAQDLLQRANESELLANALIKSYEYIDKVISSMADALVVTDHQGIVKTVNLATTNLFGYPQEELINKSISILLKEPHQLESLHHQHLEFSTSPSSSSDVDFNFQNIEILCQSKTKEEILISFSCSTIFNHQLEYDIAPAHHFVYVGRNITELKQKEREILAAREFAEQSAHAKSIFLANMSHEIRTPINGVLGMTDILLETKLDDSQQDFVENIRLSGNLLLSLINRVLDLSKLEERELELENLPFHLEQCVEEILELFVLQASNKGLDLNISFEENLPNLLMGDPVRVRQVLMNLIGNAIKFTADGEVLVRVERDRSSMTEPNVLVNNLAVNSPVNGVDQALTYLKFSVIDTGIGIDSRSQDKLFKPFSQVDASTTRRFGGTGLGLSICRQLVELMQGEIGVLSPVQNNQGSSFWFRIPFAIPPQLESFSLNDDSLVLGGRFILVIDENHHSRKSICHYLTKVGAEIYEANNVNEAIVHLESGKHIDLALIDWNLTDVNGFELERQIHGKQEFAKLPLIAILSANRQDEIRAIYKQGFCGHITKPFKKHRLLKSIFLALNIDVAAHRPDILAPSLTVSNEDKPPIAEELSNLRILLAEDNVVNQKITLTYLSNMKCQADLAENGERVLQLLEDKDYDIILMDCQMPILDGYTTTKTIRQREAEANSDDSLPKKHIVIIAMTASAFNEDRDRCLAIGMDDYLSKPIRKQHLRETLEHWMAQIALKR